MRTKLLGMAVMVSVALPTIGNPSSASAEAPEIYPLDKVRRGQKGYGLTTMKGSTPERFEFEVIGVNRNAMPKMDLILIKSDDPKLAVSGFWQGMSGSPLFIEGKLTCAFSYAYFFNKVSIGACTPIHYMKREGFLKRRLTSSPVLGRPANKSAKAIRASIRRKKTKRSAQVNWREWKRLTPTGDLNVAMDNLASDSKKPWIFKAPLPTAPTRIDDDEDDRGMVAAAVPLSMSGFSKSAFAQAKTLMADFPVVPMRAGGSGKADEGPDKFTLGGPLAVVMMRGDMSMAGTCTTSYVDAEKVLSCGHPIFQTGEMYAPVATAHVHTVIPSARIAFVIASPMREIGSLVQDRQSTIMADTSLRSDMIPVRITMHEGKNGTRRSETFNVEIMNNRFFSPILASIAASSAASHYHPDNDKVTAKMTSKVKVSGYPPIKFTDYLYSGSGAGDLVGSARGLRVLVPLLHNPFSPVEIESVELDVELSYDPNYGRIEALRLPTAELAPGKKTYVDVTLSRFNGPDTIKRIPFDVPKSLAGSLVRVAVVPGDAARVNAAPPNSVDDLVKVFSSLLPGNIYTVSLYTADEGIAKDGKMVADLPASALDKLQTSSRTDIATTYKTMARSVHPADRVIVGGKSLVVKVSNK